MTPLPVPNPLPYLAAILFAAAISLTSCNSDSAPTHTITILAAASLTEAITEIANAYEADHPDTRVVCSFAGSQILAAQILEGARFDVFLSADELQMDRVRNDTGNDISAPILFATSDLVVIAPASSGFANAIDALASAQRIALAAPEVPAGRYTRDACEQLNTWDIVEPKALALEESVRGVLTRVSMGEADAGIVYATDTNSAPPGSITVHELPSAVTINARYFAAINGSEQDNAASRSFLLYLASNDQAHRILHDHAFQTP